MELDNPVPLAPARVGAELLKTEGSPMEDLIEQSNVVVWKPNLVAISICQQFNRFLTNFL